jgi:protein tyrosine/serine phosphatase
VSSTVTPPHRYAIAALLVLSLVGPVSAQTKSTDAPKPAQADVSRITIDNFGRINSNYYRGAQPEGRDYADLAALGIKTLINLTSDDAQANEESMAQKVGMKHIHIPMTTRVAPTAGEIVQFLKVATDPASQPVYVHCVGGRHRTGVMTAVYRIAQEHWSAEQAFKEMKQYNFGADFLHPEFKKFVYGFPAFLTAGAVPDALMNDAHK